jgi:hypothetical protein
LLALSRGVVPSREFDQVGRLVHSLTRHVGRTDAPTFGRVVGAARLATPVW